MRHPAYAPVGLHEVSRLYKPKDDLMATGLSESEASALAHRVDCSAGRIRPKSIDLVAFLPHTSRTQQSYDTSTDQLAMVLPF